MSQIPASITNSVTEKAMKHRSVSTSAHTRVSSTSQLNLTYYMFWFSAAMFLVTVALFWVDIIPGFGYSASIEDFAER